MVQSSREELQPESLSLLSLLVFFGVLLSWQGVTLFLFADVPFYSIKNSFSKVEV